MKERITPKDDIEIYNAVTGELAMNKEIEEMAKEIDLARERALLTAGSLNQGFGHWYAEALYNEGYRKINFKNYQLKVVDGEIYVPLWQKERLIKRSKKLSWKLKEVRKETAKEILSLIEPDCIECDEQWLKGCNCLKSNIRDKIKQKYGVEI